MDFEANESTSLLLPSDTSKETNKYIVYVTAAAIIIQILLNQYETEAIIVLLLVATASEKLIFKLLVDMISPFRIVLIEMLLLVSIIVFAIIVSVRQTNPATTDDSSFPYQSLFILAFLDTVQIAGLVITATSVAPIMTVILLHSSMSTMVLLSKYIFPTRSYNLIQLKGAVLIVWSISIAIINSVIFFSTAHYARSDTEVNNDANQVNYWTGNMISTVLYTLFGCFQGLNNLCKEYFLIDYGRPLDVFTMSLWSFTYQCLLLLLIAPIFYLLQGVTIGRPGGYPLSSIFQNSFDGFFCVFGVSPGYFYPSTPDNDSSSDADSSDLDRNDQIIHKPSVTFEPSSEPSESLSTTSTSNLHRKHTLPPSDVATQISSQPASAHSHQPLLNPSTISNELPSDPNSSISLIPTTALHAHDDFHPHRHRTNVHKPSAKPLIRNINSSSIQIYHINKVHHHESEYAPTPQTSYYYNQQQCHCTSSIFVYIVLYVICTVIVLHCINKLMDLNCSKMSQIMLLNLCVSISILVAYDFFAGGSYGWFGSHLGVIDVLSVVLLLYGVYIYGSQQEPETELKTNSVAIVTR